MCSTSASKTPSNNEKKTIRMHSNGACMTSQKKCDIIEWNCVFRLSLPLSTQIMEIETKQAYMIFWDRSLSLKIKEYEVKSTNFFYIGSFMLKDNWWAHVSYSFS